MSTNEHTIAWELLPAYALGALEATEATEVGRHVAGCPECGAELTAYDQVADALALAVAEVAPSVALRERLLAAAVEGRQPADDRPPPTAHGPQSSIVRRPSSVVRRPASIVRRPWSVVFAIALATVVLGGLLWAAVGLLTVDGSAITLAPSDVAPDAAGELRFGGDGATLEVVGLPVLPPEQQYQLWTVRDEQRGSGAVFSVNANGWAEVAVALEHPAAEYDRFGITIEPAGGSDGPTGERVLGWRRE